MTVAYIILAFSLSVSAAYICWQVAIVILNIKIKR